MVEAIPELSEFWKTTFLKEIWIFSLREKLGKDSACEPPFAMGKRGFKGLR